MNDLNFPLILAEFLAKSAIVITLGFVILAAIKSVFPAAAKHSLWLRIFSVSLALPVLLLIFPRWEIVPNLLSPPTVESPVIETTTQPMTYTTTFTTEGRAIIPAPEPRFQFSWQWILFAIWAGGVGFLLVRAMLAGAFLRKIEQSAKQADGEIFARFSQLNNSARRDQTTLLLSPLVTSPFTWGLIRPRIVLPESAANWSAGDMEMILLHELEHVRRNDACAVLISRIFLALNWVNPFAWIAIHRATQHREEACDLRVLNTGYSAESYAAMLFRQAKTSVSPILQTCATAVAETGTIEKRIKMILNNPPQPTREKSSIVSRLTGIAVLFAIFVIGISGCSDSEPKVADTKKTPDHSTATITLEQKLKDITIPFVEFSDTPLKDALAFLQQRSVELDVNEPDPAKKGFNIISNAEGTDDIRITLRLTNVPMTEALRYTTSLAQLKFKVEPNAVVILPLTIVNTDLFTNAYQVPPTFLSVGSSEATTALDILKDAGITFPPGGSAIYNPKTSQLVVRNTMDQMELVEAFLESIPEQTPDVAMTPEIEAYLKKIESITIPSVEFVDTPIMDAAAFLQQRSVELDTKESDPAKKGINIVVASGKICDTRVNLRLTNVPLSEALRYTAELAGGGLKVDESAVVISYEKSTPRSPDEASAAKAKIAANEKKLGSIIIPAVEFVETPLTDALAFLHQRSIELDVAEQDPAKKGIDFVLDAGKPSTDDPFSAGSGFEGDGDPAGPVIDLKLSNISLAAALKYTCDLAGMEYKVEPHNLLIRPKGSKP